QNMRYPQIISDLTEISLATVIHHAGPANDFQVGDCRQLGQNVVLHTINERRLFFLLAQIFKREDGNSVRQGTRHKFTFPNDPASSCCQRDQGRCKQRAAWIALHPFLTSSENSSVSHPNRFVL